MITDKLLTAARENATQPLLSSTTIDLCQLRLAHERIFLDTLHTSIGIAAF